MSRDDKWFWEHVRQALSEANGQANDGNGNFKKNLVITTCMAGSPPGFAFEAKIPRRSANELGLTVYWREDEDLTPEDAAAFLRKLADLIEKTETT